MGEQSIIPAVTSENAGQRLDNFLVRHYPKLPKSLLYRMIRKGEVRVNSKRIDVYYRLQAGDRLRLPPKLLHQETVQAAKPHTPKNLISLLNHSILYEDDDLIVINKPNGLAVHGGSSVGYGLIEILKNAWSQWPGLELVHRLDKETSGCVMLAKRRQSLVHMHALMKANAIQKFYYAWVQGAWQGGKTIHAPLARQSGKYSERFMKVEASGDTATTHVKVLEKFSEATLLEVQPVTGRTHQIRVHTAYMGHPIIGDDKYGDKKVNHRFKQLGFDRLFLHARQLTIPREGQTPIVVSAPVPDAFQALLDTLAPVSKEIQN